MPGDSRTIRVRFDPNQYQLDIEDGDNAVCFILTFIVFNFKISY